MQRPSGGYRGGVRVGRQSARTHHVTNDCDDNDEQLTLSNSNSDDNDELETKKHASMYSKMVATSDFESAIRNLRPSVTRQKKTKTDLNVSKQKADLPQLNMNNENTSSNQRQWFPKPDVGRLDSDAFIRHNHVESQKHSDNHEPSAPPAILTTIPPVGIATRPTAIVAPAGPTRSMSALFTSKSSVKKATSMGTDQGSLGLSSSLIQTASSAFQPIHTIQNLLHRQSTRKSAPALIDIPQHKPLERGETLHHVHISHPQSPSIVHLMLHEDFNTACRLLHDMAAHSDLQLDRVPTHPFKAQTNRLCACFHEGRWFRCRILQISEDFSMATVIYLDWGMTIPTPIGPEYIRRLPDEFYDEPACSIKCQLDNVPENEEVMSSETIAQCISLLSEIEYDVTVTGFDSKIGGKVLLSVNGRVINDQIRQLFQPNVSLSPEEELVEQFRHAFQLNVGDEVKALLSSFSGKDDTFYVLLVTENTSSIDQTMSQFQETNISNGCSSEVPRVRTLVVARYADDGRWYRAWIKSVCLQRQQAVVFFVDFGNESSVAFTDIATCPETVRTLPWLGVRIRLIDEKMSYDELMTFWKIAESHYISVKVVEKCKDSYGVQIRMDYIHFLRYERSKTLKTHDLVHTGVQTIGDDHQSAAPLSTIYPSNHSEISSCLMTPSLTDQSQLSQENFLRNLFEMITKELRHLRHRINDSDEASQDRHNQLMQLLFSSLNVNNSNNSKRL